MFSTTSAPIIDEIISKHGSALGVDLRAYRGHAFRVRALARQLDWTGSDAFLQIAAATHDLAVWTEDTTDYLEPSAILADAEAKARGLGESDRKVLRDVIFNHHKITSVRKSADPAVEIFRRADWIDVTRGPLRFDLPAQAISSIKCAVPDEGFALMLRRLMQRSWRERPWRLPPMLRL